MPADAPQVDAKHAADSPTKAAGKLRLLTLGHLDGRTAAARRSRELIEAIESDLGGGDRLTEGSRQLVQRAAVLGTYIESCEAQWLAGEAVDLADYLAAINSQRRVLATIGLERRARDATPDLKTYIAGKQTSVIPPAQPVAEAMP
jgi:glutathione S-transferase